MLHNLFAGMFDTDMTQVITPGNFLVCVISALVLGAVLAACYSYRTRTSKSFLATLAVLPAVVCVVIMMVNGNVGTGVAVAGAFSLVRFRSAAGSGKEISAIFIAMAVGLVTGMGYIGYAALVTVIFAGVSLLYNWFDFGSQKKGERYKTLRITIPEDLDYSSIFDDIWETYTSEHELSQVKTTNMGSLFKLTYNLKLNDVSKEKEMIDKIRCRNGNLEISISRQENAAAEL